MKIKQIKIYKSNMINHKFNIINHKVKHLKLHKIYNNKLMN
jgi:hypothetical protein